MATILLVEDEAELRRSIAAQVAQHGHTVEYVGTGQEALHLLAQTSCDLVILDLMLPDIDGLEVCRRIRQQQITPVLMLTARASELDTVLGLEVGADDYLTKPFSMRELLARVNALLRRVAYLQQASQLAAPARVQIGTLVVDPAARTVEQDGAAVHLTAKEFDLLHLLVSHPGRVFSRDYLIERLWGIDYAGGDRTVDTHIKRLRQKLGGSGGIAERLVTLWGVGYKFVAEEA
jgi:DNA-binding response OmpR family regulator